jgi:hypothetical protein
MHWLEKRNRRWTSRAAALLYNMMSSAAPVRAE